MIQFVHIGHSGKTRGLDGTFKLRVDERYLETLPQVRAIFIDHEGSKVPYLLEDCQTDGDILVKLEEVDTPEEASVLLNRSVYLDQNEIPQSLLELHQDQKHELTDYLLLDSNNFTIGPISEILEYPQQLLAKVSFNSKSILIPIHNDLIMHVDESNKTIQMEIPEGLLDL